MLFSSVVTLCLTSIQLYIDYEDGIEVLHQRIEQIKLTNIDSIRQLLWTMDYSSAQIQLKGLTKINDIIFTELVDENSKVISQSGEIDTKNIISETLSIKQFYRNREIIIGQLKIVVTKENLYQHLIDTVVIILISQAIKTFLVSIFILLIFHSLITRHLEKITSHAEKIKINSKSSLLTLDRKKHEPVREDELERLIESINFMSDNIYNSYNELVNNQNTLSEREAKFSAIFDSITDAIVFVDHERKILQANTAFSKCFGYSLDEVKGKTTQLLYAVPEQYNDLGKNRYNASTNSIPGVFEIDYKRKDGSIFPSETMGGAVRLPDDSLIGFIGIVRDISSRKQAEEENKHLQNQLQQAQKMEAIGQLTGGIAHDFNNMLASILGYSELLSNLINKKTDLKQTTYINHITNAGERARDLIAQLLTFSRSAPGDPQAIYLPELINEVVSFIRPTIPSSINLIVNTNKKTPKVLMDSTQLHQILMNLCINARDAMEGNGTLQIELNEEQCTNITCSSCKKLLNGNYIKLTVKDTGSGIQKDILDNIFDPFKSTKPFGEGTGMGLSIVHGILHQHKSHIIAETKAGIGSSFHLLIPPYNDINPVQAITKYLKKIIDDNNEEAHVLIIDDEKPVVDFMKDLLENYNYKVTITTSSKQAFDIIKSAPYKFDLIITDQTMPEMTGTDMIKKIFAIRPDIPIILCSGYNKQIGEKEALELGCKKYLSKPINNNYLIKSIQEILSKNN